MAQKANNVFSFLRIKELEAPQLKLAGAPENFKTRKWCIPQKYCFQKFQKGFGFFLLYIPVFWSLE